jgi:hypothetical protein
MTNTAVRRPETRGLNIRPRNPAFAGWNSVRATGDLEAAVEGGDGGSADFAGVSERPLEHAVVSTANNRGTPQNRFTSPIMPAPPPTPTVGVAIMSRVVPRRSPHRLPDLLRTRSRTVGNLDVPGAEVEVRDQGLWPVACSHHEHTSRSVRSALPFPNAWMGSRSSASMM